MSAEGAAAPSPLNRVSPRGRGRSLKAITFDFWSTLVDGNITPERTAERLARLHAALVGAGHSMITREALEAAFHRALDQVSEAARESLEDIGPPGRWAVLAGELDIPEGMVPFEVVEKAYEDITLEPLPAPMPHVREALDSVKAAGYQTAVICNTGMAGGRVLREVLRRHALIDYFQVLTFSNEFGFSKPHPRIFEHTLQELGGVAPSEALHVGDVEELDIEGARRVGMFSALYAPEANGEVTTDADFVVRDWRAFREQADRFVMPGGH